MVSRQFLIISSHKISHDITRPTEKSALVTKLYNICKHRRASAWRSNAFLKRSESNSLRFPENSLILWVTCIYVRYVRFISSTVNFFYSPNHPNFACLNCLTIQCASFTKCRVAMRCNEKHISL